MNNPPDDLRETRAASLAQELRALFGKMKRRLRDQAQVGDWTPSQASALLRLETEGPSTASNLARAEGMRPQSMGTIIAALESAGFVGGAPDPNDGRQILFSLTDACRQRMQEGRAVRQDWLTRALQGRLSAPEQETVSAAVTLLKRLIDD